MQDIISEISAVPHDSEDTAQQMDIPDIDIVEDQTPLPEEEVYGFYKKNLGVILSCVVIFIAFLLQDSIGPDCVGGYGSVTALAEFLLPLESCSSLTNGRAQCWRMVSSKVCDVFRYFLYF